MVTSIPVTIGCGAFRYNCAWVSVAIQIHIGVFVYFSCFCERWKFFVGLLQFKPGEVENGCGGNHSVWVFVAITSVTARNYHYLLGATAELRPQVTEADQENTKWLFVSFHNLEVGGQNFYLLPLSLTQRFRGVGLGKIAIFSIFDQ